jgi:plastocyanin
MTFAKAVFAASLFAAVAALAADGTGVAIKNFAFGPAGLTVAPGTTVTWKNSDGEIHTVTSVDGTFRSGALDENDSYSFTFTKPGTYRYICSIHPYMKGTVTVK